MTSVLAVGPETNQYLQAFRRKPTLVVNLSDTVTVFLGDDTNVTVGRGVPLLPGFGISWDDDTPMYACSASIATVVISDLKGTIFNVFDIS